MSEKNVNPKRRFFLAAAGAVPALAAAAAMTKKEEVKHAALPEAQQQPASGVGYHETDHIRTYYFTAGYF